MTVLSTRPNPPIAFPLSIALLVLLFCTHCGKSRTLVFAAERKAQIGGEFIRLYDDGSAEYGYGVVSEKLKAEGGYRYSGDTVYFLDPVFRPHFARGFIPVTAGVAQMESGFHFLVVENRLEGK